MSYSYFNKLRYLLLPLLSLVMLVFAGCTKSYSIDVDTQQKIDENDGNFSQALIDDDRFATSLTNLGDVESDGVVDLAVGVPNDDDGGTNHGAVWILFMDDDGQVDVKQKISSNEGSFSGSLDNDDEFGFSVSALGDLNNDGFKDLAVGAPGDDDGGTNRGAVWILFMDANGTVLSEQKIANQVGGLGDVLTNEDRFGASIADIGDLNNDGVTDLAVGATQDDDDGTDRGAVWILFMNSDGSVASSQKISSAAGSFQGDLRDGDLFGTSVTAFDDLDNDGVAELVVGAPGADDGGTDRGAIWILYMNTNGTVDAEEKIAHAHNEFDGGLADGDQFGSAVANLGDLNSDGVSEIAIGSKGRDDGGSNRGGVWVLFPRGDTTIISSSLISATQGNFPNQLADNDEFGSAVVSLGDLNGDGRPDMAVGASGDDGAGLDRGAAWVLFMNSVEVDSEIGDDSGLFDLYGN